MYEASGTDSIVAGGFLRLNQLPVAPLQDLCLLSSMIMLIRQFPAPLDQVHDWRIGDHITHLDGRPVEDILDLYYYTPESDQATLTIKRQSGQQVDVALDPHDIDTVTGCFAPLEFKTCACKCVFCFIDQNPSGMRDQIYVKDEDYRFSFLYGNYITLTSLGKRGIQRIIEQKMSPLYVSVHATDLDVRTRMLGIKKRIDVMAILAELAAAGVEIHTQVVLCPGWNDGEILTKTITDLMSLAVPETEAEPTAEGLPETPGGVRSLAIVPVGLSAHRKNLTQLDPVTPDIARTVIRQVEAHQDHARLSLGFTFCYLSDEFYLLANEPFPETSAYDGFWQVDNAIGLTPRLRESWQEELEWAAEDGDLPTQPVTVLTGELAAQAWAREFSPVLEAAVPVGVEVIGVENTLYGHTVTVAGLLAGRDLRRALLELSPEPVRQVLLSPRAFNSDDLTLDGMTLKEIAEGQPHKVQIAEEEGFIDFWSKLG